MTPESQVASKRGGWLHGLFFGFVGAVLGTGVTVFAQEGVIHLSPNMSYSDLAAVLLTAVGVIVAIFGGILALAAIWGFAQLKREAIQAAENAGSREIREQIEKGTLHDYIKGEIERLTVEEVNSERMDERIRQRVDALVFGRSEDRLLDDGADEEVA